VGKYSVEFSKKAAKNYARLPEDYKSLVDLALYKLSEGLPVDIKPIIGGSCKSLEKIKMSW